MLSQLCSGLVVSKECAIFWLYHVCAVVKTLLTVLARSILSFISILTFQLLWHKHIFHYSMCTLLLVGYHACAVRNCVLVVNLVLNLPLVPTTHAQFLCALLVSYHACAVSNCVLVVNLALCLPLVPTTHAQFLCALLLVSYHACAVSTCSEYLCTRGQSCPWSPSCPYHACAVSVCSAIGQLSRMRCEYLCTRGQSCPWSPSCPPSWCPSARLSSSSAPFWYSK